jgi:hypothetical protein
MRALVGCALVGCALVGCALVGCALVGRILGTRAERLSERAPPPAARRSLPKHAG